MTEEATAEATRIQRNTEMAENANMAEEADVTENAEIAQEIGNDRETIEYETANAQSAAEPETERAQEPYIEESYSDALFDEIMRSMTREETDEICMLFDTENRGEDVIYAAFNSLCPTGEEYAFDDKACVIYHLLATRGLIEGTDIDGGFIFFGITPLGRDIAKTVIGVRSLERKRKMSRILNIGDKVEAVRRAFVFDSGTIIASGMVAAVVGFIAGIVGSLLGKLF